MSERLSIDRRKFLIMAACAGLGLNGASAASAQTAGAAAGKSATGGGAAKSAAGKLRFFTRAEFALLDEIAEMIIPADERSGGARAAGAVGHIDRFLGESIDPAWRQSWRDDLAEIERLSKLRYKRTFLKASVAQRTDLMRFISKNEANPTEPGEYAFGTIKWEVSWVYYKSKIGIHDEMGYLGNTIQDEFAGFAVKPL